MQFDLLIPKDNEKALALKAKELGWKRVIFLKEFLNKEEINKYAETLKTEVGLLVNICSKKDLLQAMKMRPFVSLIVAESNGDEEINRMILQTKGIDYAVGLSGSGGRDHTHYRRGGINQVLAKLAKENEVSYAISPSDLPEEQERRVLLLGRWMFNIKIFNKYKVNTEVFSFASKPSQIKSEEELLTFKRSLKM